MRRRVMLSLSLVLFFVLSVSLAFNVRAHKVLIRTGFEEFALGEPPKDWAVKADLFVVTDDIVKTEKKSLVMFAGADGDALGVPVETAAPIISVEFWVYIKSEGRSFNLKITSAENIAADEGGTYINWNAGRVRWYDNAAWVDIGEFEIDKWKYVRVVANFQESKFDFYSGDTREEMLKSEPAKGNFRLAAVGPVKWIEFYIWALSAPGYVDDLLAYEGAEPIPLIGAIEPVDKLATVWGKLKARS